MLKPNKCFKISVKMHLLDKIYFWIMYLKLFGFMKLFYYYHCSVEFKKGLSSDFQILNISAGTVAK